MQLRKLSRGMIVVVPLLIVSCFLFPSSVAYAQGGIAISGTFSSKHFRIPQGSSIGGPDTYVVVFNNTYDTLRMKMAWEAPLGVEVEFSSEEFTLPSGGQEKVYITVSVSRHAVPGDCEVIAKVEAFPAQVVSTTGTTIVASAGQRARLTVTGESAQVSIKVLSVTGEPVVAQVRLFGVVEGKSTEFAFSEMGTLEARVSPGCYVACAYVGGKRIGEQSFEIAAGENRNITLTVKTAYISGFGIIPNYNSGELAFGKVVYTINNLYQPIADIAAILKVALNGKPVEEIKLLSLSVLDVGSVSGSYNYIPAAGWSSGTYGFRIGLYAKGRLYAASSEKKMTVELPSLTNWELIGGIAGIVVIAGATAYYVRRRRAAKQSP
jgi:hypothetical protein